MSHRPHGNPFGSDLPPWLSALIAAVLLLGAGAPGLPLPIVAGMVIFGLANAFCAIRPERRA